MQCRYCKKEFQTEKGLFSHLQYCPLCKAQYISMPAHANPSNQSLSLDLHEGKKKSQLHHHCYHMAWCPPHYPLKKKSNKRKIDSSKKLVAPSSTAGSTSNYQKHDVFKSQVHNSLLKETLVDQSLFDDLLLQNNGEGVDANDVGAVKLDTESFVTIDSFEDDHHLLPDTIVEEDEHQFLEGDEWTEFIAEQATTSPNEAFQDRFDGSFTHSEKISIRLLTI